MTIYPDRGYAPRITKECERKGILRNQTAYILATSQWETASSHEPVREGYYLGEPEPAESHRKTLRYYPWYGRGFVQLTWEENYAKQQEKNGWGTTLTDNPDMALDPDYAMVILIDGMMDGDFTGAKLGDYVDLQKSDFYNARRVVNGTDKAAQIAEIATEYDNWLLNVVGYGVDDPENPPKPLPELPNEWRDKVLAFVKHIDELESRVADLEAWRNWKG